MAYGNREDKVQLTSSFLQKFGDKIVFQMSLDR